MTNRKIVSPSDMAFSYMGRIDFSKPDSPLFIYAGSMVSAKFTGTSVGMMIFPHLIYKVTWIGVIVAFSTSSTSTIPTLRYIYR